MDIENFYALLASQDREFLQLAWTMARGFRDSGVEGFADFTDAVYRWGLSDRPAQQPIDFLTRLRGGVLEQNRWYKPEFPASTQAFALLVNHLIFKDLAVQKLPQNWHYLPNIETLDLGYCTATELGDELRCLSKLKKLSIQPRHNFTFLPDFAQTTSLQELVLEPCYNSVVQFSETIEQLTDLQTFTIGDFAKCNNPQPTNLASFKHIKNLTAFVSEENYPMYEPLGNLKNTEQLTLRLNYEAQTLPNFLRKLRQLQTLTLVGGRVGNVFFPNWLVELPIQSFVYQGYCLIWHHFLILNELPNLKNLYLDYSYWREEDIEKLKNKCPNLNIQDVVHS